jgi:hypothetical protein
VKLRNARLCIAAISKASANFRLSSRPIGMISYDINQLHEHITKFDGLPPVVMITKIIKCVISRTLCHHGHGIIDWIEIGPKLLWTFPVRSADVLSEVEAK